MVTETGRQGQCSFGTENQIARLKSSAISGLLLTIETLDPPPETRVYKQHRKLGSILGPDSAEHPLKPWYKTQNRAKRFNRLDNRNCFGTRGVGGSNPLSPTIFSAKIVSHVDPPSL